VKTMPTKLAANDVSEFLALVTTIASSVEMVRASRQDVEGGSGVMDSSLSLYALFDCRNKSRSKRALVQES
jgi:hypothetical protein